MSRRTPTNFYEHAIVENIDKHGWHCTSIGVGSEEPCFAYSIGLFDSYAHPELLVVGLPPALAHSMISITARAAENGAPLKLDLPCDRLLADVSCVFVEVPTDQYADWVLSARWYYQGDDFPLYQIVWPSVDGPFPWNAEADSQLISMQPVLGNPASRSL